MKKQIFYKNGEIILTKDSSASMLFSYADFMAMKSTYCAFNVGKYTLYVTKLVPVVTESEDVLHIYMSNHIQ